MTKTLTLEEVAAAMETPGKGILAADESTEEEVLDALVALSGTDGPLDSRLSQALGSGSPLLREAGVHVLGRKGNAVQREAVRRLLADPEPRVRLRAAHSLLVGGDKAKPDPPPATPRPERRPR